MIRKLAVLYQAIEPPLIEGIRKPQKNGGYSDSGADIAFTLRNQGIPVVTPCDHPRADNALDWVFPDNKEGIQAALGKGATILWANTILFKDHPLVEFKAYPHLSISGQLPTLVDKFDDKWAANQLLKKNNIPIVLAVLFSSDEDEENKLKLLQMVNFPLVIKPIRGRGSQGVFVIHSSAQFEEKIASFPWQIYGKKLMIEAYLPGQELTITVMPPGSYRINHKIYQKENYWTLPIIKRFNHVEGITPYSGITAVVDNSALLDEQELKDPRYKMLEMTCSRVAKILNVKAPIRIDCREDNNKQFHLFDINLKPNMTGPGRPNRDNQDSLVLMAAKSPMINWNYSELLLNIYHQAWPAIQM